MPDTTKDDSEKFEGKLARFESGSTAFIGNNSIDYAVRYVHHDGHVTQFLLTPEAAEFTAIQILSQLEQIRNNK